MCIAGLISFILYKIGLYDITAIKMTLIAAIFPAGVISAFVMSVCIDYYKNTYIIYRKE
jgi:branched-subunit amino acid permease